MEPKIANLLSYLFGWLGGLIMYLTQKDREVRFHAAQSILFSLVVFGTYMALYILGFVFAFIPVLDVIAGILLFLVSFLLWIPVLGTFILLIVKGMGEQHFKLPVVGGTAEKWAMK